MSVSTRSPVVQWPREFNKVPKSVFYRDDVYQRELERIFSGPEWFPVAHVCEVPKPGDIKVANIGSVPVMVVNGNDGKIRVFLNSCPHRGTQLATQPRGNVKTIECPYHRWGFDLCGNLLGAPGLTEFKPGFRKEDYGLRLVRSDVVHGVVFATLSAEAPELVQYLGETIPYIANVLADGRPLKLLGYQKVIYDANWKEYADNEGYHAPLLHRAFRLLKWQGGQGLQIMTPNAHKVISADLQHVQDNGFLADHSLIETRDRATTPKSVIVTLFPLTAFVRHLDVLSLRYAMPLSADQTEVQYTYFAPMDDDEETLRHRIRQASNLLGPSGLISLEDGAVFNRLHVGSHAGGVAEFQKGVRDPMSLPTELRQNDEAGNLMRWERYRSIMGFNRDE
ncbi:MAG: aromatic ring-hydroxylating dioxygenase subunit alpha [Burkholderiaceae bacterium]|nr:MAG: aromatic ring-hydroxylating dioxygenase subunit alpha [Burkholderiaceae bacterium]TAM02115.1 MAG: aromatic ring-hydroxylating dioxygenase subunit alpha [Pusillimonas sp.]